MGVGAGPRPLRRVCTDQRIPRTGDAFDIAIAAFASVYADQSERDYAVLQKAVRSGQVEVVREPD